MTQRKACYILAILLLLSLLPIPDNYFILIRFVAMGFFGWFALEYYPRKKPIDWRILLGLALLFQPFIKLPLGQTLWCIVDVLVVLYLFHIASRIKG